MIFRILGVIAFAVVYMGSHALPAHASPADDLMHDAALFCRWLDNDSSPQGFLRAINEFVVQGVPEQTAIDTVTYALSVICPEYQDEFIVADSIYSAPVVRR